ncbi:PREDICTED: uncharacterized protein LOC105556940 [Vollenhovia emeryi]|uniref:uncharacterized protein LOC105556940 n=1 Tax=Vollenhovia emeryi TaxID=411798 RepID=UPI0005F545C6|nr:PREDICTED: uncharacterized protein LOC105556940 [Vollenhovia emeryi]
MDDLDTIAMAWDLLTRSEKSQACWLNANHHGLQWWDGGILYIRAKDIIRRAICDGLENDATIYVKGLDEMNWLKELLGIPIRNVKSIDVDIEDIDRLQNLTAVDSLRCRRHVNHCAISNVFKLRDWWVQRTAALDLLI